LDRLFYTRIDRVVRKDGTVRIDNDLYPAYFISCLDFRVWHGFRRKNRAGRRWFSGSDTTRG
jgi:hypothetical protein